MTIVDEEYIEKARKEMIQCGIKYGLKNEKTILLSKKLDILLNQFGSSSMVLKKMINENERFFYKS